MFLPTDLRNRRNLARGGSSTRPLRSRLAGWRTPPLDNYCTCGGRCERTVLRNFPPAPGHAPRRARLLRGRGARAGEARLAVRLRCGVCRRLRQLRAGRGRARPRRRGGGPRRPRARALLPPTAAGRRGGAARRRRGAGRPRVLLPRRRPGERLPAAVLRVRRRAAHGAAAAAAGPRSPPRTPPARTCRRAAPPRAPPRSRRPAAGSRWAAATSRGGPWTAADTAPWPTPVAASC